MTIPIFLDETVAQRRRIPLLLLDTGDGETEETGLTPSARVTKADQSSAAALGTVTELELGQYDYEFTAGEVDQLGYIIVRVIDAAAKTFYGKAYVAAWDPYTHVWDSILQGNTHNINNSSGKILRQLKEGFGTVHSGTAAAGSVNTITLDGAASAVNGQYDPGTILLLSGLGAGQVRRILEYDGPSRVAVVDRDWRINPDATTEFIILADAGLQHVNEGLATGGTASTIILNSVASAVNDDYIGQVIFLKSGLGQDQARVVTAYDGTTKVATIEPDWETAPDTTTAYVMMPDVQRSIAKLQADVWSAVDSTNDLVNTMGRALNLARKLLDNSEELLANGDKVIYDDAPNQTTVINRKAATNPAGGAVTKDTVAATVPTKLTKGTP